MIAPLAPLLLAGTLAVVPAPTEPVSPAPLVSVPPTRFAPASFNPYDDVAVPAFQLIGAEGVVVLSFLAADHAGDWGSALALAAPATVSLSTCGIGATSRRYRGSCWHSLAGAVVGLVSGGFVYALLEAWPSLNPWPPNPDDTQTFANGMATLVYVALIGIPVGSVIGWNVGKVAVPEPAIGDAGAPPPLPPPAPSLSSSLALRGAAPGRLVVPLLAGRF